VSNRHDDTQRQRLAQAILANCVIRHGGSEAFAKYLGVTQEEVIDWLGGKSIPSVEIIRKAVEPFIVIKES
jgi:hypothetical protein